MGTKEFAVIDPTSGVLFRAPYFDDALRLEEGPQVVGVLTLTQVHAVIDVVGRLNRELMPKDRYHAGFMPDHRIASITEDGLVSRELLPVAATAGIVIARVSLVDFREEYLSVLQGQNPIEPGRLLAA